MQKQVNDREHNQQDAGDSRKVEVLVGQTLRHHDDAESSHPAQIDSANGNHQPH